MFECLNVCKLAFHEVHGCEWEMQTSLKSFFLFRDLFCWLLKCAIISIWFIFYRKNICIIQILKEHNFTCLFYIYELTYFSVFMKLYIIFFCNSLFPRYAFTASNPRHICWTGYKYWHCNTLLVSLYTCGLCMVGSCSSHSMWVFIPLWLELIKHCITI